MAYISAKEVKAIRDELKVQFPEYKFGCKKGSGGYSVDVTIKKGPANLAEVCTHGEGYAQVNQYHLHHYGEHQTFLEKIMQIIKTAPAKAEGGSAWYDNSNSMIDYFDTAFYIHLNIGDWNQPYQCAA